MSGKKPKSLFQESEAEYFTVVFKGDITKATIKFNETIPGMGELVGVGVGDYFLQEDEYIEAINYANDHGDGMYWLNAWADNEPEAVKELKKYMIEQRKRMEKLTSGKASELQQDDT